MYRQFYRQTEWQTDRKNCTQTVFWWQTICDVFLEIPDRNCLGPAQYKVFITTIAWQSLSIYATCYQNLFPLLCLNVIQCHRNLMKQHCDDITIFCSIFSHSVQFSDSITHSPEDHVDAQENKVNEIPITYQYANIQEIVKLSIQLLAISSSSNNLDNTFSYMCPKFLK